MRPTVFIADDHRLLLEALRNLLEPRFVVIGTALDGREMLAKVRKSAPDIVLMDISMPNLNGFEAGEKLKKMLPDIKLVFLTANEDPGLISEAVRIGADGYLLKNCATSELFRALDTVLSGGRYVTPTGFRQSIHPAELNRCAEKIQGSLTLRQREVLQLLAEGSTMKEAASILNITPRTVAFHKYQTMEVLAIETNSELIRYAIKHGLAH